MCSKTHVPFKIAESAAGTTRAEGKRIYTGEAQYTLEGPKVKSECSLTAIPQPEGSEERYPSVLLDLGVGEKAEEIRMTL